ncbi:MAG TPA: ABC transporter ATP-binding protein [Candidatus Avilachnospira avicola]|nr:ABC transporter ATP-binding protein [Candidatus Avilachnospira avicola]
MLKIIKHSLREYKTPAIMTMILVIIEGILECMIPFTIAQLITGVRAGDMATIQSYGLRLILLALFSLLTGAGAGFASADAVTGLSRNLRKDMFAKIQTFSFENIDKFSTPSIVTRLTTDVMNVQQSFMMIIRMVMRAPVMILFATIMALRISSEISMLFLGLIPIVAICLFGIVRLVMPIFRKAFHKYDDLNASIEEDVEGIRVVKAYVHEDLEIQKFEKASANLRNDFTKAERILAWNMPILQLCIYSVITIVLYLGSMTIIESQGLKLNVGGISSIVTYGMQILMSLNILSMVFTMISMSMESAERIEEILDEEPRIKDPKDPVFTVENGSIDFENVYFAYGPNSADVLKDINLHIAEGETIGIVGGTGSSKTTLISLISRLYDVTAGRVRVGGRDVREYDLAALRDAVSVVLQKNVLFSGTIKDNMRWGNKNATDEEIVEACKLAQADEFISTFPKGYDTYIEQGGTNVSGGQKQRLCIARALLKKPKVLILDDSTSAVDTYTDALIRKAFREYLPQTTKIIIAQRISSVQDCDRIIVMHNGEINGIGNHEELLKSNDIYREVYESQQRKAVEE